VKILKALLKALRPKQWIKNGLLLVAIVFSERYMDVDAWMNVSFGVAMFCMLSSAGYLVNDLKDVEADRAHPKKQFRPIASGDLPSGLAWATVVVFILAGLSGAFALHTRFGIAAITYLFITLSYSNFFKHTAILDVMLLSSGFIVRAVAGAEAIQVPSSPWFLVCIAFGALFIGLIKRLAEIRLLKEDAGSHRKALEEYSEPLLLQLISITTACSLISYALYTFEGASTQWMMLTLPIVIFAVFRYLLLVSMEGEGGEPSSTLLKDKALLLSVLAFLVTSIVAMKLGNAG
jgi:4-hydroxybenzoate polyprenyltransferase